MDSLRCNGNASDGYERQLRTENEYTAILLFLARLPGTRPDEV